MQMELWEEAIHKYRHERCPDGYGVLYRFKRRTGSRKAYIGISGDFPQRYKAHVYGRHHSTREESLIHRAIKKYGINDFDVEIFDYLPDEELSNAEREEIALQNTIAPNGYNLDEGGTRARPTEDTKQKRSDSMKRTIESMPAEKIESWRSKMKDARSNPEEKAIHSEHKSIWWKTVDKAKRTLVVERATETRNAGHVQRLEALRKRALPFEPIRSKRIHGQLYIRHDGKVARANPKLILVAVHPRLQK